MISRAAYRVPLLSFYAPISCAPISICISVVRESNERQQKKMRKEKSSEKIEKNIRKEENRCRSTGCDCLLLYYSIAMNSPFTIVVSVVLSIRPQQKKKYCKPRTHTEANVSFIEIDSMGKSNENDCHLFEVPMVNNDHVFSKLCDIVVSHDQPFILFHVPFLVHIDNGASKH